MNIDAFTWSIQHNGKVRSSIQKIVPWKPYFPFHRLTPVAGEVGEKAGDARAFNRALKV